MIIKYYGCELNCEYENKCNQFNKFKYFKVREDKND